MSLTLYRALHIQSHSEQATCAKNVTGTESLLRMWSGVSRDCTVSSGSDVSSSYFSHVEAKHEVAAAYHCNLQALLLNTQGCWYVSTSLYIRIAWQWQSDILPSTGGTS